MEQRNKQRKRTEIACKSRTYFVPSARNKAEQAEQRFLALLHHHGVLLHHHQEELS